MRYALDIDVKELKRSYETLRKNALELFRSLKVEDDKKRLAELEAALSGLNSGMIRKRLLNQSGDQPA